MPIYEYECKACHHQLEVMQKMNDPVLVKCPECGKKQLQRLISSTSFQLKGGGWYATDFKDKPKSTEKNTTESNTDKKSTEK